ncbi:STAS domain-containing protein [Mobilicoccus pelagius]|uniref:Anti-sigma factor antagonist n=1 Tax=Mobilicoccus pelagius NBRC 104925 TaxID=1089455 RepID=H5UNX1_9MICO|nr:STAS domain-containing protein [Mobilicoccus pelagius]GAB47429.1 putative antagonist protein [Mobilicoccus pelagius NBRC 104925]
MTDLSVTSEDLGPFTVVQATGDIDLVSAPVLRNSLESLFRQGRIRLVLDLRGVPFVDSTGLGILVGAQRAVAPHGGEVRLVCTAERVLRVFSITGLDQVFSVHTTPAEAAASAPPPPGGRGSA